MNKMIRCMSVVALLILASGHRPAFADKTVVDPNSVPKVETAAPVLAGKSDTRLDQKITYTAGNVRFHTAVKKISDMTGVRIYCGTSNDDWHVRDIPVTIAVKDMPLRKLLYTLVFVTHTSVRTTKADNGDNIYRIWRDSKNQAAIDDFAKAQQERRTARANIEWDQALKLKDMPLSTIKFSSNSEIAKWERQRLPLMTAFSRLLATIDKDTRARVISGEPVTFAVKTAREPMRQSLIEFLVAGDTQEIASLRASPSQPDTVQIYEEVHAYDPATSEEIEAGAVRLAGSANAGTVNLMGYIRLQRGENVGMNCRQVLCGTSTAAEMVGRVDKPKEPRYPNLPEPIAVDPDMNPIAYGNAEFMKGAKLAFDDDKEPKDYCDAIIALSKTLGYNIVCEDFQSGYGSTDTRQMAGSEMRLINLVGDSMPNHQWDMDPKTDTLAGTLYYWADVHNRLCPAWVIENIEAKANSDGVDLEDVVPLAVYPPDAYGGLGKNGLPQNLFNEDNKDLWALYATLSPADKVLARSEAGLPLGKFDRKYIASVFARSAKNDTTNMRIPVGQELPYEPFTDPAVAPTLIMHLRTRDNKLPAHMIRLSGNSVPIDTLDQTTIAKIPAGMFKSCRYVLEVEGTSEGKKIKIQKDGPYMLPAFSTKREKEIKEMIDKATGKGNG